MKSTTLLCLPLLLWQLVAGQIYPHLSFMLFSNHSYIDLSLIGENDDNNILQCSTDLITCCSSTQGDYRGDWYYPNGEKLQFSSGGADIYQRRDDRVVKLLRRNGDVSPTGIYRCEIPTTAVHNDSNGNTLRDVLYVGLYISGGMPSFALLYTHACMKIDGMSHYVWCMVYKNSAIMGGC